MKNYQDTSKEQLIKELEELQQKYDSLKAISDADIYRLKQEEEKLSILEQRNRAWLENSPVCTKIVDLDFNLQYMSNAGIKGLQIDDITAYYGKPYPFHFYPESFKTEMKGNMNLAKETGKVITQEAPVVDINGHEVWYQSTIVPVKDTNNRVDYLMIVSLDTTERKLAEEALKNSKRDLQTILEATTDGIWKWNFVNSEMYFSPQYYKMLGYEPDEFPATYDNWVELIHPDDRPVALGVAWEYLKTKPDEYENEFRLRTKHGEYRWIHSFGRIAERNPDGEAILIIGNHYDINDHKLTAEALKQSEELFKAIFENSLNPIMIADDAGNYLKVNQAAAGMFHYPVDRILQMNVGDIQTIGSPDAAKRYQEYLAKGYEIGEFDFVRPDKSWAIAQYHAVRVRPNFNMSILSDITERKMAEEKLKVSEAKYRQLYEFNQMPIAIFDVDTLNFLSVNNAWVDKYGYTKEELLSMTILEIRPEFELERVKQSVKQISDGLENAGEYLHKKKNGEIIKVEIIRYDLMFEGKNAKLVFANDITDRKLAETALAQSRSELKAIYEYSPIMMCLVDANRQIMFANQAFTTLTGTDEKQLKGGHACGVFGCINALDDSRGCGFGTNCRNCNLRLAMDDTLKNGTVHTNVEYHTTLLQNGETRDVVLLGSTALIENNGQPKLLLCLSDITERKLAEEALRISETNYRRLFETLSEGVALNEIIYNDKGEMVDYRILEVNNAFYSTSKYNGPVIGRLATDLYQLPVEFITAFWREHKERNTVKFTEMTSPINSRNMLIATSPFIDGRFVTSFIDITERKNKEELIKKSERELNSIVNSGNIYIIKTDMLGNYIFCNRKFREKFGWIFEESEIIGRNSFESIFPEDHAKALEIVNMCINNPDTPFEVEVRKPLRNGEHLTSLWNFTCNLNLNGEPSEILCVGIDISERKKAEKALLKSEAIKNKMLSNIGDVIVIVDKEGVNRYKSPNIEKLFGWKPEDLVGKSTWLNVHPEDLDAVQKFIRSIADEPNMSGATELRYLKKDGSYCPIEISVVNLTHDPDINGFLGNYHDISERKKAEDALIVARQHAEESDRLKSAFLANMSHEIRTPMNGILGFAEILKDPELTGDQQQEYLKIIEKSGKRMLNIINDIVDISKIESGLMKLNLSESNINEQIEYIYTFFKPEVEAKGMKLSFNTTLSAKEATILTDREKVYAIFTNLVKNAIKYSKNGFIEIGYKIVEAQCIAPLLQFYVKDTGIGIPPDRQNAIFERFIQADIADKMARQGAGLGLAITKSYIEMLGGKIWVESQEGEGSTFYFTLPYNQKAEIKNPDQSAVSVDGKPNWTKKLKILIAEDDPTSEMLISLMVNTFGKEILKVETGLGAVEACRQNPDIDLILMDIQMPEMGGYEAAMEIREFNKNVVIIAQTAYGLSGDREKAIEAGCNDYIAKPINKDELLATIRKHCEK